MPDPDHATDAGARGGTQESGRWISLGALAVAAGVVLAAVAFILLTRMRPSYDAFGWLTWGRETLHWNLDTNGAPSWKPLTFLFTLPYALTGAEVQLWLWMITATAGAFAGSVFAARIAYRLTRQSNGDAPRWTSLVAGGLAAAAVLGLDGYSHQVLIANSDPLLVTLCLAALDAHLCGRRRLTFGLLLLVSLGRPEGWALLGLYAVWLGWRGSAGTRAIATVGLLLVPVAWFSVPALTSHSWLTPGDLALGSVNAIHGNKLVGVLGRLRDLYELPMQLAVAATLIVVAVRRERTWLGVAAAAGVWVATEIAFAYHGWSAVPRYLFEPAAVLVVLACAGAGRVLAWGPARRAARAWAPAGRTALAWAPAIPVLALVVALVPAVRQRARVLHSQLPAAHHAQVALARLEEVIRRAGGPEKIKSCGQPVSLLGYQSELAWAVGLNVGNVGWRPGRSIDSGQAIVLFKPYRGGWLMMPVHLRSADVGRCRRLRVESDLDPPGAGGRSRK